MQERGLWKRKVELTVEQTSRELTNRKSVDKGGGAEGTLKLAGKMVELGNVKGVIKIMGQNWER